MLVSTVIHHIDPILQTAVCVGVEKLFLCGVFPPFLPSPQQLQPSAFQVPGLDAGGEIQKNLSAKDRKCQRNKTTMDKSMELQEVCVSDGNIESGQLCFEL